ncbi:hypothetical protein GGS21DRAFT_491096 [Xylaria nigripes]|nr:hypothetical protein GGS21DRAFT_491096 [Xylaria nigripes]
MRQTRRKITSGPRLNYYVPAPDEDHFDSDQDKAILDLGLDAIVIDSVHNVPECPTILADKLHQYILLYNTCGIPNLSYIDKHVVLFCSGTDKRAWKNVRMLDIMSPHTFDQFLRINYEAKWCCFAIALAAIQNPQHNYGNGKAMIIWDCDPNPL